MGKQMGIINTDAINKEIIEESIYVYGKELQSIVCMEELSELIQAISKEMRGRTNKNHLAEEMADVLICIEMAAQIYGIDADVLALWIEKKQQRIKERMAKINDEDSN